MKWLADVSSKLIRLLLIGLIYCYQWLISPMIGFNCRHLPTCSNYAKDALKAHGPLRGFYFSLKRILRCHPWAEPMVDPVPPASDGPKSATEIRG